MLGKSPAGGLRAPLSHIRKDDQQRSSRFGNNDASNRSENMHPNANKATPKSLKAGDRHVTSPFTKEYMQMRYTRLC